MPDAEQPTWESIEGFLIADAEHGLRATDEAAPCLVAFAGSTPLLLAHVRPFSKGEYHGPLVELLALAAPLGADRLMLSITGRAWSLGDPIPPVDPELGDLRQRVLTVESVDGVARRPRSATLILPFERGEDTVRWGEPVRMSGAEGWIPEALTRAVRMRRSFRDASVGAVRQQLLRCADLGHTVALGAAVVERLGGVASHDA